MIIDAITLLPAYFYYWKVKSLEKKLGYRVELRNLEPDWINGTMIFEMTPVWKKHGIAATGVNYYTIGAVKNSLSSRFNPLSPYFQSWLGGYIVQFDQIRNWTAQDHFALGEADQKTWLSLYGDSSPLVTISASEFKDLDNIQISGFHGKLYECGGWSHSDVGSGNKSLILHLLMSACANIFNISNKSLNLIGSNFIPKWSSNLKINSYQKIYLKGYVAIVSIDVKTKAVLYANATILESKDGKKIDYFSKIKDKLKEILLASKITRI